ncbi:MAG: outer membrane protein assembly factor BamA [Candidatus Cloacimonadota bacterium]|nr:MAG: outer membrane protein assembly factor BamA [Candidatus Cloacimonadota bacterium]
MQKRLLVLIIFLISCRILFAQSDVIFDIRIEGNQRIDKNLIKNILTLHIGETGTVDRVSESIKKLYQLGVFSDVKVFEEPSNSGIALIFKVKEYPTVRKVEFKGNNKFKDKTLRKITELKKGAYFSPFLKAETEKKIKNKYKERKYHNVAITFEAEDIGNNQTDVVVNVKEGEKVRVRQVIFHGNREISSKKLARKIKTKKAGWFRSGKFEEKVFEEDLQKIVAYYNKKGYIDANVISYDVNILNGKDIRIDIYLIEGMQYRFGKVTTEGNNRFTTESIEEKFKFKDLEVFNMDKYNKFLQEVSFMYYEEGYIYARFDQELIKEANIVNVNLKITENTRARVRKIFISGNRRTKEKIIRRQLSIHPGDYYRRSRIMQSQRNIYNMGFFEPDIGLDIEPINTTGDIDVMIRVNDKTSGSANGGIGYNSQDKFVGNFSISHNNLFGNAWGSKLNWEFGGSSQNFDLDFTNPYILDTKTLAGFNLYRSHRKYNDYNYEVVTNGGGVRLGHHVSWLNYAKVIGGYYLSAKEYTIQDKDDQITTGLARLDSLNWQYNSHVSFTFTRDSRDNIFFPTTGSQFTLYYELGGGLFGGDFDYFKQISEVRWYTKTFWKFILRNKWRFGYVTAYGNSEDVPPEEKFYLGGTGQDGIRGYRDRSIAPESGGGKREIIFSSELAFPIGSDQFSGLIFFDSGNSYNHLSEFNFWEMKKGTGVGIRIQSPLGLIGFDYALNLEKNSWEPHIQLGTTF